jgi:hypothetical protein
MAFLKANTLAKDGRNSSQTRCRSWMIFGSEDSEISSLEGSPTGGSFDLRSLEEEDEEEEGGVTFA